MQAALTPSGADGRRVTLRRTGLTLGGRVVPLLSGSVHYFRLAPETWRASLLALKSLGLRFVDTYVPWSVHELSPGRFDFGARDPRLDVARFLRLAAELDLLAIVRPGPHVNAELTQFGIPERVLWRPSCQALSAGRRPVVLPVPPLAFPVPSYASREFHAEAASWLRAVGEELGELCWPHGPIALLQVDNEGAFYFRDGIHDQDYHPDAIAGYRRFLGRKYASDAARLSRVHGVSPATLDQVEPPTRLLEAPEDLARHLDWAEFQEQLLSDAFAELRRVLDGAGFAGLPTLHNLPIGEGATPLDPALLDRAVDFVGLDYYHGASEAQRGEIARRTSALALRSREKDVPAFACELGAGFPPFFPPLTPADNAFAALCALAYGLSGFNLYMAVDRDRWIGAPFTLRAERRPTADFWERLVAATVRLELPKLTRVAPVHLVIPRSYLRLVRVLHAFGPASAAMFRIAGGGPLEACWEGSFGLDGSPALETDAFARALEQALELRRIPYAVTTGDLLASSLANARWVIVLCPGVLERGLADAILAHHDGARVQLGPRLPTRDESLEPLARAPGPELVLGASDTALGDAVDHIQRSLGLPSFRVDPAELRITLLQDDAGVPRVLFVINASDRDIAAAVGAFGADYALDALDGTYVRATRDVLEIRVAARSVRMLELRALL